MIRIAIVAGMLVALGVAPAAAAPAADPVLTCQRMVTVPDDVNMWTVMSQLRPGDCVRTESGTVPPPPAAPAAMAEHCAAIVAGTAHGRVRYGNGLGHLKGGDEMWEGDQAGSPPRPAPGQDDVIFSGPAYDTILDYGGDNCLYGEDGADWIHGGWGNDLVDGASGADTLYSGSGDDYINGDDLSAPIPEPGQPGGPPAGNPPTNVDLLDGGPGDDVLVGGFGVDEMYGGTGNDLCIGTAGGDGVDLPEPAATDAQRMQDYPWVPTGHGPDGAETGKWLNKFHSCETIWTKTMAPDGTGGTEAMLVVDGTQPPESAPGSSPHQGPEFWPPRWLPPRELSDQQLHDEDAREATNLQRDLQHVRSADPRDPALVTAAFALIAGFATADDPACGAATLAGGDADDYLAGDLAVSNRIYGGNANNRLDGFGAGNCLVGGPGQDVFFGGRGDDLIYGGGGVNHVYGGAANDVIYGGPGDDWIYGGAGDDVIDGGGGVNHCFGQSGHSVFINCQYIVSGLDEQTGNWGNIFRY